MTKRKSTLKKLTAVLEVINGQDTVVEKDYTIKDASIKDDFCNYTFEITNGVGAGDTHTVKGSGVIDDDLRHAMGKLNVHLAAIDDVFKHSGVEIEDINQYHGHDLAHLYRVTGFKIKGGSSNESVILTGSKFVASAGGRIELVTPKVPLENLSGYAFWAELKESMETARYEVEMYKEGKSSAVEKDDDGDGSIQLTIGDAIRQSQDTPDEDHHDDDTFSEANKI